VGRERRFTSIQIKIVREGPYADRMCHRWPDRYIVGSVKSSLITSWADSGLSETISIQRRFPTYDFVLNTSLSVVEASAKLDSFFSHQERPKGFVLTDPRVDGTVSGPTFSLRRRQSGFGGSVSPYADGYFVPAPGGASAVVRVQIPAWWWLFDIAAIIAVLSTFEFSFSWATLGAVAVTALFLIALSIGPVWAEAPQVARVLQSVLAQDSPPNSSAAPGVNP
jgi:hypothetical protein